MLGFMGRASIKFYATLLPLILMSENAWAVSVEKSAPQDGADGSFAVVAASLFWALSCFFCYKAYTRFDNARRMKDDPAQMKTLRTSGVIYVIIALFLLAFPFIISVMRELFYEATSIGSANVVTDSAPHQAGK